MGNSNSEFDSDKVRRIRVPLEMVTCCGFYFVSRLTFLLRDLIVFARFNFCFVCVVVLCFLLLRVLCFYCDVSHQAVKQPSVVFFPVGASVPQICMYRPCVNPN